MPEWDQGLRAWMAPNQPVLTVDTGVLANNVSAVIIPAPLNKTVIHLFTLFLDPLSASAFCHVQNTLGTDIAQLVVNTVGVPANAFQPLPPVLDFRGAQVPVGPTNAAVGVQVLNTTGANQRWVGYVTYSLYPLIP
jgi:hypothetical protein